MSVAVGGLSLYTRQLQQRPGLSVNVACSQCCGFSPLRHLYFCTDCHLLLCPDCTVAHIDSYYCPSCLTSVFSSSAQAALGRCEQCVECPVCAHSLQTAFHASTAVYSFLCSACRWASYSRSEPQSPASLCASDVTALLSAVRAREADETGRSECQRLIAQYRQSYKQHQQERRQERERLSSPAAAGLSLFSSYGSSSSPSPAAQSSVLTSASMYAAAAASYRPSAETSPLQRFLALDAAVGETRRALHHSPASAAAVSSFTAVPDYMKGRYAMRAAESAAGDSEQQQPQRHHAGVTSEQDSQTAAAGRQLRVAAAASPLFSCSDAFTSSVSGLRSRLSHPALTSFDQASRIRYRTCCSRDAALRLARRAATELLCSALLDPIAPTARCILVVGRC